MFNATCVQCAKGRTRPTRTAGAGLPQWSYKVVPSDTHEFAKILLCEPSIKNQRYQKSTLLSQSLSNAQQLPKMVVVIIQARYTSDSSSSSQSAMLKILAAAGLLATGAAAKVLRWRCCSGQPPCAPRDAGAAH